MSKIIRTVKYMRSPFGTFIKWVFILFNLVMLAWIFSYWGDIGSLLNKGSGAEQAGAAIGSAIGTGLIFMVWATGAVVLGIPVLLTKGKRVEIEEEVTIGGTMVNKGASKSTATEEAIFAKQTNSPAMEKVKTTVKIVLMYFAFALFSLMAFGVAQKNFIGGIFIFTAALLLLPPLRKKYLINTPLKSENMTAGAVVLLIIFGFIFDGGKQEPPQTQAVVQQAIQPNPRTEDMIKDAESTFNKSPDKTLAEISSFIDQKNFAAAKEKTELLSKIENPEIKKLHEQAVAGLEKIAAEEKERAAKRQQETEETAQAATWIVNNDKSAMDDTSTISVYKDANAPVDVWLGKATPTLLIRCQERKTDVMFIANTNFTPVYGEYEKVSLRVRIDDSKASAQLWLESTDGKTAFAPNPVSLLKKLQDAKTLRIEFNPFNSGLATAEFNLRGLKRHVEEVEKICR